MASTVGELAVVYDGLFVQPRVDKDCVRAREFAFSIDRSESWCEG